MTTPALDLLDAIRAHLTDFELPDVCSLHLTAFGPEPQVSAQLAGQDVSVTATALLIWADSLSEVTAEAWRVRTGNSVHLSVTGRRPDGVLIRVYGAVPFTEGGPGGVLDPGGVTALPLTSLRAWANLTEVSG